jgi:hypothetical protein
MSQRGASKKRATPIPRGSRPSTAALTRLGARKANDIVMLTWGLLQASRAAMQSIVTMRPAHRTRQQQALGFAH